MNKIDEYLTIFTKYIGDKTPRGLNNDIAKLLGVSRERVRQRANRLKLLTASKITRAKALNPERLCIICGKELPIHKQKFCSYKCYRQELLNNFPSKVCLYCHKSFKYAPSSAHNVVDRKYCSQKCYYQALKIERELKPRKLYSKTCVGCGQKFQTSFKNQRYHNHPCYSRHQGKIGGIL